MKPLCKFIASLCVLLFSCGGIFAENYTIGLAVWSGYPSCVQGFKDGLVAKGLIEGQQIEFIQGDVGADKVLQTKVAQTFKAAKVDMVFTLTTPGTVIMKELMPTTTPLVFSVVTYPADSGLIESFEYSGNNLVGTSNYVPLPYYIDLLQKILPFTKRAAIFHRKGEPNSKIQAVNLYRLLKRKGIDVMDVPVTSIEQAKQRALELADKVDVFITTTDTLMQSGGEAALIEISLSKKIPILSSNKKGIEQGATFGVVADFYTLGKMSGLMAAQLIIDKVSPESIESKIQTPPTYLINKNSFEHLGLKLPSLLDIKIQWTK